MSRAVLIVGLALSLASCGSDPADASGDAASDPAVPELAILAEYGGPDGGYDYLSVDSDARRVFAAREFGVMAVDLDTGKVTDRLIEANDVSAVLPIAGTNEMLSTVYGDNEAVLFDRGTGEEIARIAVGEKPDAAAYDPDSGLAFVMNAGGNSISLIDVADRAPVGTIAVGGKPEAGAIDGKGHLFVNIEDTAEIAVIDIAARKVARRLPLPGCVEPTGIAYDALSDTLISACHNGVAKLIDAGSGADKGTVQVGRNADGAIFDPGTRLAYIPAKEGTLTLFRLAETGVAGEPASVPTRYGARTAALDPATGRVYLSTADFTGGAADEDVATPSTFRILELGTK